MATSIIGYPGETNYCPSCGTSNVNARDSWHQDGLMICQECNFRCYVILAESEDND